ncbi:MAG: cytochrome c oxidase subunit I [Alphaproteobacteria bacterium]|uniref:Cytochrome c oxidase subunit 1 n=1 Tax=Candidatus Nitrobium versatile TaxID=2884831 RepID=A0A953JBA1_9BACT|nr:cytochrome c oxidase subunit I [Candidatus Nitrobium versatile]
MEQGNSFREEGSFYEDRGRYRGFSAWMMSVDHKRIGIMYLAALLVFFASGTVLGLLIRLNLIDPGRLMSAYTYNRLFTMHGIVQIFLFIIPGIPVAFGNFFLPLLIGARDVAFPRLNRLSWWLYLTGAVLVLLSLFFGGGALDTGWTFYAPYSLQTRTNVSLAVFAVFVLGFSSILTGLNFVTTIHRLRAPGMTWFRMPLFVWTLYATGWVQLLATPVLALSLLLIILERFFGLGFFDPAKGGDPLLFEHLFWIYSHPAVYIMILPAMGVISEIIPVFARKTVFGYKAVVFSSLAIASVGYLVWGHHMFTSGMSDTARAVFSLITFLVAVPSGVKVFNWVATLHKGSITVDAPLLFALTFIFLFSIGGLTGLVIGALATNLHLHGTYFIVAHFHYVMFGGVGYAFLAGLHYWFPKMFGKMYDERTAKIGGAVLFVGFNLLYFSMFLLGVRGMPRRYFDYPPHFFTEHLVSTVGSWIVAAGLALILVNLIHALFRGKSAPADPWGGGTLEWSLPSPPPAENFKEIPVITRGPYSYR